MRASPHKHWVWAVLLPSLPLVSRLIMLCTIQWCFVEVALPLKNRACAVLLLWLCELRACFLGLYYHKRRNHRRKKGLDRSRSGFTTHSVVFSIWFAFSSYTYVVVTCAIILEWCYYAGAVASFLLFPWWPGRMSSALARLLTLRLPCIGWVSSEPFCSVLNRVPLSLIFCPVLPRKDWQPLDILLTLPSLTIA